MKKLVENITLDQNVKNGIQKPIMGDVDFMTRDRVYECI